MTQMAWDLFGNTPFSWQRVQTVMDWAHARIKFGYEFARPTKTAYEACNEQQGVCRDYQHLAITMLRALNIPARYATGYLGDIGIPLNPAPMDFSAWLEVYLGGHWYTLDARHNKPRIGRILQARGRDAVDVALTTSFGPAFLQKFTVWAEEIR
jgi:transglutaminase-like putative cysteine protease